MKLTLVYLYPALGDEYDDLALRFLLSYSEFPPGFKHDTVVVCNGGNGLTSKMRNQVECIGSLPNLRYFEHSNAGKDIGAYQAVTRHIEGDWFVFFGASAFFWKAGWLKRVAESISDFGESVYGTMIGRHSLVQKIYPHIRSTCFWTTANIMNRYPLKVTTNEARYDFEYRRKSLTMWAVKNGYRPKAVTWDWTYDMKDWGNIPDGFQTSDQSGLLFKERLASEPYYTEQRTHE